MTCCSIHQLINSGDREGVLWTCFIKVCVVDADSPFPVGFFDHDYICKPFKIVNFPDKLCYEQLSDFFVYGRVAFGVEFSLLLNDEFVCRIHVEPVD